MCAWRPSRPPRTTVVWVSVWHAAPSRLSRKSGNRTSGTSARPWSSAHTPSHDHISGRGSPQVIVTQSGSEGTPRPSQTRPGTPTAIGGKAAEAFASISTANHPTSCALVSQPDRQKPAYALSYNDSSGTANWVSWRLEAKDMGDVGRGQFHPDELLPGIRRVWPWDYTGSGFDRGHLCPHGDRNGDEETSDATFAMTNVIPQSPAVDQNAWERLERYCRTLARKGKVLYIVSGPWGSGGTGSNGYPLPDRTPDGRHRAHEVLEGDYGPKRRRRRRPATSELPTRACWPSSCPTI